jgi:Reverse transcriptase (RNA-dependent DNA polymerase)
LMPDFKPIDCKIYPLSPKEQLALQEFIEENLRTSRIQPSKSPNALPFFFGMKPDGSGLRPIQDYRKLNEFTVKNRYPLPLIGDIIDKLKGEKYFTKLDVRWGFNNVRIHEGDEWKAAFRTNLGLFEPTVMFFGLTNSPATFQTMMNHILRDLINEGKVAVYLDDILIFTKDLTEHREVVSRVLQILRENKLSLKPQKCEFEKEEMKYLGMIIGHGEVRMDQAKVAAVGKWPTPKNKKEVQQFLGFANYYR